MQLAAWVNGLKLEICTGPVTCILGCDMPMHALATWVHRLAMELCNYQTGLHYEMDIGHSLATTQQSEYLTRCIKL